MCGFLGKMSFNDFDKTDIITPNKKILCRGPDKTKDLTFSNKGTQTSLIFNRLAILDLSEKADQPMVSRDDNYILMFNGEIFNHVGLRRRLEKSGSTFYTSHSDTEVVLEGLISEGLKFVTELRGQFSICFIDKKAGRVHLIRDRLGQKPLYYTSSNTDLIFGSNLNSVQELIDKPSINEKQVINYIKYGVTGKGETLLNSVNKVLPAEVVTIDYKNLSFSVFKEKYWSIQDKIDNKKFVTEEFIDKFSEAVRIRADADVPVANFLSGGLDSTSIVKNMHDQNIGINSFTVASDNKIYDESFRAKTTSLKYQTNHQVSNITEEITMDLIDDAIGSLDEPYSDPSVVPSYLISKKISEKYKVAITGDGGDELLGGYQRTKISMKNPNIYMRPLSYVYKLYPPYLGTGAKFLSKNSDISVRYRAFLEDNNLLRLLKIKQNKAENLIESEVTIKDYKSMLLSDYQFYLPEMMMYKIDRTSMANSIETRSPFVDHELIEYVFSHTTEYTEGQGQKQVLKDYLVGDFGKEFVNRKKQGFVFDIESWIFNNVNYFYENIKNSHLSNYIDLTSLNLLKLNKSRINSHRIWKLYVLGKFIN